MSHTEDSLKTIREGYRSLSADNKIMFWIHFAVAPSMMVGAAIYVVGWGPVAVFAIGFALWKGSEA